MPTVEQLAKTQDLVEASPLAFVAAFFALATALLLVLVLRQGKTHARALAEVNAATLRMSEVHTQQLVAVYQDLRKPRAPRKTEAASALEETKP